MKGRFGDDDGGVREAFVMTIKARNFYGALTGFGARVPEKHIVHAGNDRKAFG
jgi:hypothetical protein